MRLSLAAAVIHTDGSTQTLTNNAKNKAAVLPRELCTAVQAPMPEPAATEAPASPDRIKISIVLDDNSVSAELSPVVTGIDLFDLCRSSCRFTT